MLENLGATLTTAYLAAEEDLVRFIVSYRDGKGISGDDGLPAFDSMEARRELAASDLRFLSKMRSMWKSHRAMLLDFIEHGDELYIGIPPRPIGDPQTDPRADPDRYNDLRLKVLRRLDSRRRKAGVHRPSTAIGEPNRV
ncbi:MAG TPA: hypothetical protein VEL82_03105 [Thermoplasmata archaeon]|nr:hypothetical protein [Thermoplasmata archaeon]